MKLVKSRIFNIPAALKNEYAIVSMPEKAWEWLDDLVSVKFPWAGYQGLLKSAKSADCAQEITSSFRRKAQEGYELKMAQYYNLANDNAPANGYGDLKNNPALPETPDFPLALPSITRLFHFMPHATYLTTIWERKQLRHRL